MARILIVDDSDSQAEYMRAILRPEHEVDIAHNGRDAMRLAWQSPYDLVITDIFMPDMDGLETIRDMRRALPGVPVIAISASPAAPTDFLRIAATLGAADTIRKPVRPADLRRLVEARVGAPRSGPAALDTPTDSVI